MEESLGGFLGKDEHTGLAEVESSVLFIAGPQVEQQIGNIRLGGDAGQVHKVIQALVVEHGFPVQVEPELLIEAHPAFGMDKSGDILGAHFLGTGAVAQIEAFGATVGPIGAFGHVNDQQLLFGQLFYPDGHGRVTGSRHILDLGQGFVGQVGAHDLVVVVDADENAPARGVGQGHQLLGQVGENTANPLRVNDRKRCVDEVFLLDLLAVDDEALEQVQELQLAAGQVVVLADELVKGFADRFREAFQDFDAQDVADELDEAGFADVVDPAQQVFGYVRVLGVEQLGQFIYFRQATSSPFLIFCRMGLCAVSSRSWLRPFRGSG
jgi:hypothetical protein